jgi:imidazolonepropionase-like amidohydrolase
VDEEKEILLRAMEKKIPVRIFARKSYDIETALRLSDEFGFTLQLEGGEEAFRYCKEIAERKVAVALMPSYATSSLSFSGEGEVRFDTFSLLTKAGVLVALLPGLSGDRESMLAMAAFAIKYGATKEEALRAVTLVPAEMLGIADRVGSLEEGKDADFIILNGDPLDVKSRIEWVFIDGARVFGKTLGQY